MISELREQCRLAEGTGVTGHLARSDQDLTAFIFDGRRPIQWHRAKEYQRVSLKMIAQHTLSACRHISAPELEMGLYFPGELACENLAFDKSVRLLYSAHNPGAAKVADLLTEVAEILNNKPVLTVASYTGNEGKIDAHRRVFFLLYLNRATFLGDDGEALAGEVRRVLHRDRSALILIHENERGRSAAAS